MRKPCHETTPFSLAKRLGRQVSTSIQRINEAGGFQLLQKRVIEKVFRFYLRCFRTFSDLQNSLDFLFGHQRQSLKDRSMFVVDRFEQLSVIRLHESSHYFYRGFFVAVDDGDRLGITSEIAANGIGLLLDDFSGGDDGDKDKRNIELSDVENMLESQFLGLKGYRSAHESGGGVA